MKSLEDKELLWDLISDRDTCDALNREIQSIILDIQLKVIKHPLDANTKEDLVIKKARADGALELATTLLRRLQPPAA